MKEEGQDEKAAGLELGCIVWVLSQDDQERREQSLGCFFRSHLVVFRERFAVPPWLTFGVGRVQSESL